MATTGRIYICVECDEDCTWHVLDASTCELLPYETLKINQSALVKTPLKNGSAALDHCIYVIGGSCKQKHNVKIYNTKTKKWRFGKNMDVTRHSPLVVPVPTYNMLFVFGGTTEEDERNWAECYYIDKDKWEVLQSPDHPKNPNLTGHFVLDDTLVLWNQDLFYTFNLKSKKWTYRLELKLHLPTIHGDFFVGGIVPRVVHLGDFLFWFNGVELLNYHLSGFIGEDNTLDSLVSPQEAKTLYQSYFRSLTSCFLVACSEEKKLCLIWCDEESESRKRVCLFTFHLRRISKHGPFYVKSWDQANFETVGARICHCLTMQQPSEANSNDKSGLRDKLQCEEDLLKGLSRGMYIRNYLSLARHKDCEADSAAKPVSGSCREVSAKPVSGSGRKVEISISSLVQGLGLATVYESVLERIIDKNILNQLNEDDIKALNIPVSHKPARCTEEQAEGDSDTEENPRDLMCREVFALRSSMPGFMLPNLRKIREEPVLTLENENSRLSTVMTARLWTQEIKHHHDKAIPPWKI